MSTNSKVSQDSDEYRKWKEGVSKSSSKLKSPSEIEEVDISFKEINQVLRDRIILSFDDFFGVTDYQDRAKKIYYLINFSVYYFLCCCSAYFYYNYSVQDYQFPILFIMFVGLITAITFPIFLLIAGFTVTGGAFVGILTGFFGWFIGSISRLIYRLLGLDIQLIYPNLVGKSGVVSKHNLIGRFSKYPFTAKIESTGIYGDSILYRDYFAIRSDEKVEIGTPIQVVEHEKRTLLSFIKNHPTLKVLPITKDTEGVAND